jgi:hypothetical protein
MLKIVAYYTNNYYYSKSIDLSHSMNKWGACYEIKKVEGPKTWAEAVSYKPRFILDCMVSSTCDSIGYTDVDSRLLRAIPHGALTGEVAYTPFQRSPHNPEEALTGTLFFKNTPAVQDFVREWIEATPKYRGLDTPEQLSLRDVLASTTLDIQRLGPEWCWIFDDFKELFPNAPPPIFEHYQASREYKTLEAQGKADQAELSDMQGEGLSSGYATDPSEWTRAKGRSK